MPPLTHTAANKLFIAGTAAMMYQSTGFMETLDRSVKGRFQYKVAFMPKKKSYGTDIGGTGIGVFKSNPAREKAAWTFVQWMTDTERSAFWSEKTGYIAARKSSHKFPSHMKFLQDNPNNRVAADQLPHAAIQYAVKADGIIYKPIGDLSEKIESSPSVNIKKELDEIVKETIVKMKQ
jgi:sn-glycerol 3-phosphate transport system substrate-binding protein